MTKERKPIFKDNNAATILAEEFVFYSEEYNVELISYVIMHDHFHCVIWPQGKYSFSDFMRGVKGHFSKKYSEHIQRRGAGTPPITYDIWQTSFFDYLITSEHKLEEKIQYIMWNPVKEGFVSKPEEYPFF